MLLKSGLANFYLAQFCFSIPSTDGIPSQIEPRRE